MHQEALQLFIEVLGQKHPSTLTSIGNLARVLDSQGKYDEADAMHREALQLSTKALGQKHPDTFSITNYLALVLKHQGNGAENVPELRTSSYSASHVPHRSTIVLRLFQMLKPPFSRPIVRPPLSTPPRLNEPADDALAISLATSIRHTLPAAIRHGNTLADSKTTPVHIIR
ncbi:hypothetical protein G7Y89_g6416 [Cudoniella acicularis]|uniref:Kinesin light chain n=1 Tax=Cudoniella acicularis TaxID=354080 RepID=A0A8H4RKJ6_9HELO|nr:hypothetical protein G7Y89_g6416 [Cudoniella acicularis]